MEKAAICSICGGLAKPARTCMHCGALCCTKCFRADLGLCVRCAQKAKGRP